jgi:hypothetical protein
MLKNKAPFDADEIDVADEDTINAFKSGLATPFTLKRSDLISEKTSRAIQPGDAVCGWIGFEVPGVALGGYNDTNLTLVLSFLDINGDRVFVTNGFWKGKPTRLMKTLPAPRTLPGSGNLISQPDTSNRRGVESNAQGWLPPELPPGCSNVTVFFGSQGIVYPITMAKIPSGKSGAKFEIKDLPDYFLKDLDKMTNYSPLNRSLWLRWDSITQDYGGKTVNFPILPYVLSNRLFVEVEIPFLSERRKLIMSDEFDDALSLLPRAWDRNCSTNSYVYEFVNEDTIPVLQVLYTAPNEVHVNGVFVVDTNSILESFGESTRLWTVDYRFVNVTNREMITNVTELISHGIVGEKITNAFYHLDQPSRKAIFKYPSNRYPSVFAE